MKKNVRRTRFHRPIEERRRKRRIPHNDNPKGNSELDEAQRQGLCEMHHQENRAIKTVELFNCCPLS